MSASLALQPLAGYALPITTSPLAEIPLQGLNPVKPNIMLTIDDSGSMAWDFVPDFAGFAGPTITHCRDGNPQAFQCGGLSLTDPFTGQPRTFIPNGFVATQYDPPIRSSAQNKQYYDPNATYLVGKRADGTDLPYESANPGTGTSVYNNGFAGYPGANTGGTINLTTGYPDTAWCNTHAANPPSSADLLTAFGDGSTCRLNGRPYKSFADPSNLWTAPAVGAGYNYPNVKNVATGSNTACASANEDCVYKTPATVTGAPFYYTISKVQYCSNADAAGFGTSPCQDRYAAATFKYARYGTGAASFDPAAFTRYDIKASGFLVNGVPGANPSGRTYADEIANFAKWYTFYRTRILSMQTGTGIAFSALSEDDARVGFHTLRFGWNGATYIPNGNTNGNQFLNVLPFSTANKDAWFAALYGLTVGFGTPLPDAVWRIGELFAGNASGLPGATDPLDRTTGMCQPNYHLLSTDGYWNYGLQATSTIGDEDKIFTSSPSPIPGFTPGAQFPRPYYEGAQATTNNLADLSMHYWINDLRPDNVTWPNKVKDTIAPWQHVTLYGLSIGAQGSLPYPSGINDIVAGTDWPTTQNGSPPNPNATAGPEAIDDLWHAAINSRGKFFNATTPLQLAESIVAALADFTDQSGTGTAVGIAGAQFSASKSFGYRTSYETGWWGDVKKYALDPTTGALPIDNAGNPVNAPLWSAATQLDAQVVGTGWDTNRRILTINGSTAVPFRLGQLSSGQQASLNAGWSVVIPAPSAQSVLNYLRGDVSNEGTGPTNFRIRSHILGDIAYSGAVPVGAPGQPYSDAGNPGYSAFVSAHASRTPMLYVGANDGMLHVFDDSTTSDAGKETWAFIPSAMFSGGDPNDTVHTPSSSFQIGSLTYRRGGIPLFAHKFFVNATPRVWDVDFANTNTSTAPRSGNDWRTILVGGLGAGGRSIYALDVTDPVALTESEASIASSGRVLWEFTDANLGYVFDPPTLVKTYRYGWVVLVPSGYNNPGGKGILYVLNPTNGAILKTLSTGIGSDTEPSGLSTIRAFAPSRKDPYMLQAYGGDLRGNVWRFDLSSADDSQWKVELIAKLTDAGNKPQPITTGIRIEIDQNNFSDRYIFVGTGKLLGKDDIADATVGNTLYVIRDGKVGAPDPAPATPYSRADLNAITGSTVAGFSGTPTGRGWYQDGADLTWKIGTDVFADVQTVVYAFSKPNTTDPCAPPLSSTLFARNLNTGNSVLQSEGGSIVPSVEIGAGIAGVALIQGQGGTTGSVSSGDVRAQVTTMAGQVFSFGVNLAATPNLKHRVSWRLLNRD